MVLLDQLEKAFMVIGGKMIAASSGVNNFDDYKIREENITSELVIKQRPRQISHQNIETRQSLNDLTKQTICDMAVERYGVDMNFRTEKKELITQFLALQEEEEG